MGDVRFAILVIATSVIPTLSVRMLDDRAIELWVDHNSNVLIPMFRVFCSRRSGSLHFPSGSATRFCGFQSLLFPSGPTTWFPIPTLSVRTNHFSSVGYPTVWCCTSTPLDPYTFRQDQRRVLDRAHDLMVHFTLVVLRVVSPMETPRICGNVLVTLLWWFSSPWSSSG